tara:strand:+ start:4369 stop:4506 length:138 start_codon:yes stop_codon:yes gene_type:complete
LHQARWRDALLEMAPVVGERPPATGGRSIRGVRDAFLPGHDGLCV